MAASVLGAGASSLLAGQPLFAQADTGGADAGGGSADGEAVPEPASAAAAGRAVEAARDAILRISREVWAEAELSLAEHRSSQIHLRELEAAGFRIVSTGTSGTPTAFVAEWSQGAGGPIIGFLPEYDALPGLGNAAEPRQAPGPTGIERGHGCGHNMLGAGCTGAAFALKALMQEAGTEGTIRVYGCAAEETQGVKVYMARDGLFDDCDACLAWHPAPIAATGLVRTTATNMMRISFRGRTAHAGNSPWEGRSALKAAELFATGIQFMREHILPSARLHYVYTSAGTARKRGAGRGGGSVHDPRRRPRPSRRDDRVGAADRPRRGDDDPDRGGSGGVLRPLGHPAERAAGRADAPAHDGDRPRLERGGAGLRPGLPARLRRAPRRDSPPRSRPPSATCRPAARRTWAT